MSTSGFDATDLDKKTLRIARSTATGEAEPHTHVTPRKVTVSDVNGDGRDDLIAVFELDWADLRTGWALAVLTAQTGRQHAHVDDVEPKKPNETKLASSPSKSPIAELPNEQDFNVEQPATPMLAALSVDERPKSEERSRPDADRILFEPMLSVMRPSAELPAVQPISSAAFTVHSTDTFDATRFVPSPVSPGRSDANSDQRLREDRPSATFDEHRDVDDDDRDDLVAIFELDWAELWDGQESAVLTGRLA
jgi:hypothetical protein